MLYNFTDMALEHNGEILLPMQCNPYWTIWANPLIDEPGLHGGIEVVDTRKECLVRMAAVFSRQPNVYISREDRERLDSDENRTLCSANGWKTMKAPMVHVMQSTMLAGGAISSLPTLTVVDLSVVRTVIVGEIEYKFAVDKNGICGPDACEFHNVHSMLSSLDNRVIATTARYEHAKIPILFLTPEATKIHVFDGSKG